jgi:hypothetical protein
MTPARAEYHIAFLSHQIHLRELALTSPMYGQIIPSSPCRAPTVGTTLTASQTSQ